MTIAVIMGTKIIAPNIWGWIADHTGQRMRVIRVASLLSVICFAGVYLSLDYTWLLLVMVCFSFFWNANLPQFEAVTLSHLGKKVHNYSGIRLWGSLGFVLLVTLLGAVFEQYGVDLLPTVFIFLLLGIWLFSLLVTDKSHETHHHKSQSFKSILRRPPVLLFFIICFLLQASHGPYYAFYSLHLEQNEYTRTVIGQLWALGVIAEILIFLFMHKLLPKLGAARLLFISLLLTTIRWWLIGHYVDSMAVMFLAQCLHAASFGIFHSVAIHQIHQYFPANVQGRGQALYSSVSFGAGGAVGALYSGYSWDQFGAEWSYNIAGVISFVAVIFTLVYMKLERNTNIPAKT